MDILLDIHSCGLGRRQTGLRLRQYRRAVRRQLENGPGPPMKFSEFLSNQAHAAAIYGVAAGEHDANGFGVGAVLFD